MTVKLNFCVVVLAKTTSTRIPHKNFVRGNGRTPAALHPRSCEDAGVRPAYLRGHGLLRSVAAV